MGIGKGPHGETGELVSAGSLGEGKAEAAWPHGKAQHPHSHPACPTPVPVSLRNLKGPWH